MALHHEIALRVGFKQPIQQTKAIFKILVCLGCERRHFTPRAATTTENALILN